jgi:hypothetical protein
VVFNSQYTEFSFHPQVLVFSLGCSLVLIGEGHWLEQVAIFELGATQWIRHWSTVFFATLQGGHHPHWNLC